MGVTNIYLVMLVKFGVHFGIFSDWDFIIV